MSELTLRLGAPPSPARGRAIAGAVILLACACGNAGSGEAAASREDLGACSLPGDAKARVEPAHSRLARTDLRWVGAAAVEETSPTSAPQGFSSVRVRGVTSFGQGPEQGAPDTVAALNAANLPYARRARESARRFVVGIGGDGRIGVLAATDDAGDVAFVGDCQYRFLTEPFDRFVAAKGAGRRPVDVLRSVTTPAGRKELVAFFEPPPPPTWAELPPSRRQLDESTPAAVRAALSSVSLNYEIPREWRSHDEVGFCGRLAIAWGDCTSLTAWAHVDGPVTVAAYASTGEGIELWALGKPRRLDAPLGRLVAIPADVVARAVANDLTITVRPVAGIGTFEEFRAALAAGRDTFEVASVA